MEEENINVLAEFTNLTEKEKIEIKSLKRGESLIFVGDEHILAKIDSSELEEKIICKGDINEENNNCNWKCFN